MSLHEFSVCPVCCRLWVVVGSVQRGDNSWRAFAIQLHVEISADWPHLHHAIQNTGGSPHRCRPWHSYLSNHLHRSPSRYVLYTLDTNESASRVVREGDTRLADEVLQFTCGLLCACPYYPHTLLFVMSLCDWIKSKLPSLLVLKNCKWQSGGTAELREGMRPSKKGTEGESR